MFNPLGMYDVSNNYSRFGSCFTFVPAGRSALDLRKRCRRRGRPRVSATLTFEACLHGFAVRRRVNIFHYASQVRPQNPGLPAWIPHAGVLQQNARHVWVLWHSWWLYGAPGALVCISWQMGGSAPPLFSVMMSHVSVYQRGHTQLSLHLLWSPSPGLSLFSPLSLSLNYTTQTATLLTSIVPREPVHLYLQTQLLYTCLHAERFGCVTALYGALKEKARAAPTTWCGALIIACSWYVVPISVP